MATKCSQSMNIYAVGGCRRTLAGRGRPPTRRSRAGCMQAVNSQAAMPGALDVHRRADEREVGEGLRVVAEQRPGARVRLLRVQAQR